MRAGVGSTGPRFRLLGTAGCGPRTATSFRYPALGQDAAPCWAPPSHRAVLLAALLLRLNRTVRTDDLADVLRDHDELPTNPRAALQIYVSRLGSISSDRGPLRTR